MTPFEPHARDADNPAGHPPRTEPPGGGSWGGAYEPELPRCVPIARPVSITASAAPTSAPAAAPVPLEYGRDARLRPVRALFELLMLIPAGFLGGVVGYIAARSAGVTDEQWRVVASTFGMGGAALLAAMMFVFIDNQCPADIGWTSRRMSINLVIGIAALINTYVFVAFAFLAFAVLYPQILKEQETARKAVEELMPRMSIVQMALFMLFVSIWEEVVFRGFVLTRLKTLLRTWWLAVPVSSMVFGAIHIYEGPLAVAMITILGLVMAGLFIWRRSLVPCMTLHFLNNFLMLLLLRFEV